MNVFLNGASVALACVAALFFLRFWRDVGDRLFGFFAAAFAVLAVQITGMAFFGDTVPATYYLYVPRLVAFVIIILGVIDKNRRQRA